MSHCFSLLKLIQAHLVYIMFCLHCTSSTWVHTHGKLVWKHSAPHLTFTKWFVVNKSLLLDVQGYHYHLYWIILNRISTFPEYILIFVYYLKNKDFYFDFFSLSNLYHVKQNFSWLIYVEMGISFLKTSLNDPNLLYNEMTGVSYLAKAMHLFNRQWHALFYKHTNDPYT